MSKATWTPRRFARRRVWRIIIAACATLAACGAGFIVNQRKSIALEVDGKTKQVTTYAASLPEFLKQQHVTIQSHDQAQSQSGYWLSNDDIVRVRKAYEVMLNIDGHIVPYWTYANSAAQLEQYFHQNDQEASKVSVDIPNVYNELSGGILLDTTGNVQVIANGKTSTVNGNQTVASILDSEGVNVGPDTLVSVQHRNNQTVLMVQKVSYATVTKTVNIAFNVQTVMDPNLYQGTTVIRQQGVQGSQTQTLKLTYLDGKQYSEQLLKSVINKPAVNEIIALGTKKKPVAQTASGSSNAPSSNAPSSNAPQVVAQGTVSTQQTAAAAAQKAAAAQTVAEKAAQAAAAAQKAAAAQTVAEKAAQAAAAQKAAQEKAAQEAAQRAAAQAAAQKAQQEAAAEKAAQAAAAQKAAQEKAAQEAAQRAAAQAAAQKAQQEAAEQAAAQAAAAAQKAAQEKAAQEAAQRAAAQAAAQKAAAQAQAASTANLSGELSPAQAQSLARAMEEDRYGWGSGQFSCLISLWNRESGWRWNAENAYSGAYGIPQALPPSKMGAGYQYDARVQISWGLSYIAQRYGTPCGAWGHELSYGWY